MPDTIVSSVGILIPVEPESRAVHGGVHRRANGSFHGPNGMDAAVIYL